MLPAGFFSNDRPASYYAPGGYGLLPPGDYYRTVPQSSDYGGPSPAQPLGYPGPQYELAADAATGQEGDS